MATRTAVKRRQRSRLQIVRGQLTAASVVVDVAARVTVGRRRIDLQPPVARPTLPKRPFPAQPFAHLHCLCWLKTARMGAAGNVHYYILMLHECGLFHSNLLI